jgi:protein ImuB
MGQVGLMRNGVVGRLACVELTAFPLQCLLKQHPDWVGKPVVVVGRDKPQGVIWWVNKQARTARIHPGMRYSAGLSLVRTLHAGEVSVATVAKGVAQVTEELQRFSPEVEPSSKEPGVFWLNASGLSNLYPSLRQWANEIRKTLTETGFRSSIVVGFSQFGTYAIAKEATVDHRISVVRDQSRERALAGQVRLKKLGIDSSLRDNLYKLGIRTVRDFLKLPSTGVRRRFGVEAERLHQQASGDLRVPLQPLRIKEPLVQRLALDDPEINTSRLLFLVKRLLNRLLVTIVARHESLVELIIHLQLDHTRRLVEHIRPAEPTVNITQLMNLIRLRVESSSFSSGVSEIQITAKTGRSKLVQQGLFINRPRRDFRQANRALARVRARYGDDTVVRARLVEAHLPEACYTWELLDAVVPPSPVDVACRPMVRRIHAASKQLSFQSYCESNGSLLRNGVSEQIDQVAGPYFVSGGWWHSLVHREYYFAQICDGDLLWIYYDRPRRQWCWQGQVE